VVPAARLHWEQAGRLHHEKKWKVALTGFGGSVFFAAFKVSN
jgi:hypothetical protein